MKPTLPYLIQEFLRPCLNQTQAAQRNTTTEKSPLGPVSSKALLATVVENARRSAEND